MGIFPNCWCSIQLSFLYKNHEDMMSPFVNFFLNPWKIFFLCPIFSQYFSGYFFIFSFFFCNSENWDHAPNNMSWLQKFKCKILFNCLKQKWMWLSIHIMIPFVVTTIVHKYARICCSVSVTMPTTVCIYEQKACLESYRSGLIFVSK